MDVGTADPITPPGAPVIASGTSQARTAAYVLSAGVAALTVIASLVGLLADDLYRDGPWAREALRGGDLVSMVVAAPLLILSLF